MKAEELRIGNLVLYQGDTKRIAGITEEHPYINDITFDYLDWDEISPVLLTEEWLLELGFKGAVENAGNLPCFKKGNITIAKWIGGKWQSWYKTIDFPVSPQTVHKLQNLYFALTGEELFIKHGI